MPARFFQEMHGALDFPVIEVGERVVQDKRRPFSALRWIHGICQCGAETDTGKISEAGAERRSISLFSAFFYSNIGICVDIYTFCRASRDHFPISAETGPYGVCITGCQGFFCPLQQIRSHRDLAVGSLVPALLCAQNFQFLQHLFSVFAFSDKVFHPAFGVRLLCPAPEEFLADLFSAAPQCRHALTAFSCLLLKLVRFFCTCALEHFQSQTGSAQFFVEETQLLIGLSEKGAGIFTVICSIPDRRQLRMQVFFRRKTKFFEKAKDRFACLCPIRMDLLQLLFLIRQIGILRIGAGVFL